MSGTAAEGAGSVSALVALVHRQLLDDPRSLHGPMSPDRIEGLVRSAEPLLAATEVNRVVRAVTDVVTGLGPLAPLLADPSVSDILVNGSGAVWIERRGHLEQTALTLDRSQVELIIERILGPLGRRVDPVSPTADARLPDGSRVHVVVPPLAVDGPCLTIRRFRARPVTLAELAPEPVAELLRDAVRRRANIAVTGGTGSGKTTVLNALAASLPGAERVVTVEDAAELRLPGDHVVRLETRPGSVEGVEAVGIRELVRNALRMRPDRLIIGEVRGAEALDLVQAMNTGHDGSLTTVHSNGCRHALRRLETLVLMGGVGLPLPAVRDHLTSALDLVVHVERTAGGSRQVVEVAEVAGGQVDGSASVGLAVRPLSVGREVIARPERPWAAR